MWSYAVFLGIILKKRGVTFFSVITGDTWLFRENVEKNEVLAFFHVFDSRKRVHCLNFCHDSVIEGCSKIRNEA